jgi:hypothetical protein
VQLEDQVNANPLSYSGSDGRQYVAVIANERLIAFALPEGR